MLAAVMFVACVVVWAAAVKFGQFVDDAATVVWAAAAALADVFVLAAVAVVLAAVTVWNAYVVELRCCCISCCGADITGM